MRVPNGIIRVLPVDDHAIVRSGIRLLLEQHPGIDVAADVAEADDALEALSSRSADVALVDVTPGDTDGIALTRLIRGRARETKVVALTMHDDPMTVREMPRAGASAYVVKGAQSYELLDAPRMARGRTRIPRSRRRSSPTRCADDPSRCGCRHGSRTSSVSSPRAARAASAPPGSG